MNLPKELTTITPLSKILAAVIFIFLPIVGFFLGIRYQEMMDLRKPKQMEQNLAIPRAPTPIQDSSTSMPLLDLPLHNISNINQQNLPSGNYNTQGFVHYVYACGECQIGAFCEICGDNYIIVSESITLPKDGIKNLTEKEMKLYVPDASDFLLNKKYNFSINNSKNKFIIVGYELIEESSDQVVCAQDVKLCSDGKTYVSRQSPNCEFAACPN